MGKQGPPSALGYRRVLISFFLLVFGAPFLVPLNASTPSCSLTVLPNNGNISANARAPNTNFKWGRAVYLITATELAASGFAAGSTPTAIGWNYQSSGELGATPLLIYFENTTDTINTKNIAWATAITGMTLVHNAMTAFPSTAGPFDITLIGGSPFTYTGGGLYIAFDWGEYTGTLSTGTVALCTTTLPAGLLGAQNNSSAQINLVASNFRPETRLNSFIQNDAAVTSLQSLGSIPLGTAPAQLIRAVVTNNGVNTVTNLPVTLNITGSNPFNDTQIISSLSPCGGRAIVAFAPFTPATIGSNTVQVSIPNDDVVANNSLTKPLDVTSLHYSYKYPGSTPSGGTGFTNTSGAFVGKFTTTGLTGITHITFEFFSASGTTYRAAIYGDSGSGTPSTTPLYLDTSDRTIGAPGPVTITLPAAIFVGPGNFYVGLQQTNLVNFQLGFDSEIPIRTGTFYLANSNPPSTWSDFAPGANFKLNIGVILQDPNATPTPTPTPTPSPSPTPTATPINFASISGTIIYCSNPSLQAVPGVTMTLTGSQSTSTLSDGGGNYVFSLLSSAGNYTVTPTKGAIAPGTPGINTVDVIAVQRHFLNIALIPVGCRRLAADVSGDSVINTVDVIAIQRFFLGLSTGIANTGKYQFSPVNRSYPGVPNDQTGQSYDALIFGDVTTTFVQ